MRKSKAEGRRMKDEGNVRDSRLGFRFLLVSSFILHPSSMLLAAAHTQQEVLDSINQNVGQTVDGTKLLGSLFAIAAIAILIVLVSQRHKRKVTPKSLNHPGRLLKEVSRSVNLRPAEVRQIKLLSEGMEISSPLVLLLCPSVLAGSIKEKADRVDRPTLANLAKRLDEE